MNISKRNEIPPFLEVLLESYYDDSSQGYQGKENHPNFICAEIPSHSATTSRARIAPHEKKHDKNVAKHNHLISRKIDAQEYAPERLLLACILQLANETLN